MAKSLADFVNEALKSIEEVTPERALEILEAPDCDGWHFIDVREPDEFVPAHIRTARNFPRGFLEVRADLEHYKRDPWLEDRNRKLILYCGGGHRSALATRTLAQMGFVNLLSLREGWTGWIERGFPIETAV